MKSSNRRLTLIILALAAAVLICWGAGSSAFAQQRELTLPSSIPRNQKQGGSVLEVPTIPGHQSSETQTIPRMAPQQGQELTLPSRQLARQPGYNQLTVTILDQQGRYVTGLQKNDFRLYIDGQQRPIEFFRQDLNTPVSIGILVDTSGSMEPKLMQARTAITEFVNDLNPRDDVFLFAFSSQPFLLQPFTTDHQAVIGRLSLLYAQGETAIFDTIIDGLLMVRHGRWDKKALLVVTDGQDNASEQNLQQVIAYARQMGVLIYSIGIGNSNIDTTSIGFGPLGLGLIAQDAVDARTLELLSNETGAKTFLLRTIGDGQAMREDCAAISRELREQYTIGFLASDPGRGGYRNVRVDVPAHPDDKVRVRKGVEVGGTESASADPARRMP
ncbi:MAG TPA: VWA domain-containing protein [Candidatus Binataceae bacterium]|nr:VWA domain-containing protein [Candidatus Binataceae bacterium]